MAKFRASPFHFPAYPNVKLLSTRMNSIAASGPSISDWMSLSVSNFACGEGIYLSKSVVSFPHIPD